ncbi:MAG: AraC family transcriptional regulator [Gemmatimonadaceae bacterium]
MNCINTLLRSERVSLTEFHHPADHVHHDPESEVAECDSVNFVEGGTFDVTMTGASRRIDPRFVFVATRGMQFSCSHDSPVPTDRCLSVLFAAETVEDLRRVDVAPLRPPAVALTPRLAFLRHRLRTVTRRTDDAVRFELLAGALFEAVSGAPAAPGRHAVQTTAQMKRLDRTMDLIESDFARPLSLKELADAAGLSPFHFAREFKALTGLPPHRFLTGVRLRHAARLLDGGASVSFTCYEVGFTSPAHFVTAFRRRFGVLPSHVRRGSRVSGLRAGLSTPIWRANRHG